MRNHLWSRVLRRNGRWLSRFKCKQRPNGGEEIFALKLLDPTMREATELLGVRSAAVVVVVASAKPEIQFSSECFPSASLVSIYELWMLFRRVQVNEKRDDATAIAINKERVVAVLGEGEKLVFKFDDASSTSEWNLRFFAMCSLRNFFFSSNSAQNRWIITAAGWCWFVTAAQMTSLPTISSRNFLRKSPEEFRIVFFTFSTLFLSPSRSSAIKKASKYRKWETRFSIFSKNRRIDAVFSARRIFLFSYWFVVVVVIVVCF